MTIKLFVVGYPLDIQEAELIELFSNQGMIDSIQLITDKVTHQHKGFGFVEMMDQAGADRAIAALNGIVIKGRKISVKLADENRAEKPRTFRPNRFASSGSDSAERSETSFKNKRPRKLISNTSKPS